MISPSSNAAFTEIGKAIYVSQLLEKILTEMFEFRKLHADFEYAIKTQGEVGPGLYKSALMNGIKCLRTQNVIDPSLDEALVRYIEDRHLLVHRWVLTYASPSFEDDPAWDKFYNHAKNVVKQVSQLYDFFALYLEKYGKTKVAVQDYLAYEARMLNIFNRKYEPK